MDALGTAKVSVALRPGAVDPGRPPKISKHGRTRRQARDGEVDMRLWSGTGSLESVLALERVEGGDFPVGGGQVAVYRGADRIGIAQPVRGFRHGSQHLDLLDLGPHELGLEASVEVTVGGEAFGVGSRLGAGCVPAVEVDRRMLGLRAVGHVVREQAGVVEDARLDPRSLLFGCASPGAKAEQKALVEFFDPVRKKAHVSFRPRDVRRVEGRQEPPPVSGGEGATGHVLEIDVVIVGAGFVQCAEFAAPPSVGFDPDPGQLIGRVPKECGHVDGQTLDGSRRRDHVPLCSPRRGRVCGRYRADGGEDEDEHNLWRRRHRVRVGAKGTGRRGTTKWHDETIRGAHASNYR